MICGRDVIVQVVKAEMKSHGVNRWWRCLCGNQGRGHITGSFGLMFWADLNHSLLQMLCRKMKVHKKEKIR